MTTPLLLRHTTRAVATFAVALCLVLTSNPAQAQAERQALKLSDVSAVQAPAPTGSVVESLRPSGALVDDPSFEATPTSLGDNPFWDEFSATLPNSSPFGNGTTFGVDLARTGDYFAIFGFADVAGTDFVEQTISFPEAGFYDLTFYFAGGLDDVDGDGMVESDATLRALIDGTPVFELTSEEAPAYSFNYNEVVVPITVDAAGDLSLRIELEVAANPAEDDVTQIILDDVTLAPGTGAISIAEARALGVDETVTVEGVVSRAKGDFTYIQDETAGLTIRQTSGAFFDAVADGTISEGTELLITGTLSEFANLLQINDGDLDSYEILGDGDAPAAQSVTLQELVDSGEDYEAELVRVTGLTTDAMGTFAPATTYDVNDGTANGDLRIPNEEDSDVDGTAIPEAEFVFEGVVGQFDFDDPTVGYQLLAIEESDITEGTIVDEAIHDTGDVQLEVYDFGEVGSYADADGVSVGTGFVFGGENGLYESTFLVGVSPDQVSGDAYEFPDLEWATTSPLSEAIAPEGYDQAFSAGYDDSGAAMPIGVEVSQLSYSAEDDDFVIVEFDVLNTSGSDLADVYVGIFADWDVGGAAFDQNLGAYNDGGQVLYVWDGTGGSDNYFGVVALNGEDGVDVSGVFYDALPGDDLLYTGLSNTTPDATVPGDRRTVLGVGPYDITAGESVTVQFAYVGGEGEQELLENAFAAQAAVAPPLGQAVHDTGDVQFEVFADGDLGTDSPDFEGTGFVFDGAQGLFASTVLVGAGPEQVSGMAYEEGEWVTTEPLVAAAPPFGFEQAFGAAFDDSGASNPIGVEVDQLSYSTTEAGLEDFVIVEYSVENTTDTELSNIYVGVFADWDVGSATANLGGYDEETQLLYVYDDGGAPNYFGVAALDAEVSGYELDAGGGTNPTEVDLWAALTNEGLIPTAPADRRTVIGSGPYFIPAGEEVIVRFAYVGGEDLGAIVANAAAAQQVVVPVASEETTQAGTFTLHSAYPNPFAATTTIGFSLPAAEHVRLTVYDILGRRVATLIDGVQQAGEQTVRFDASNLGSGTYIYRLEAGGTQLTERFTVVR